MALKSARSKFSPLQQVAVYIPGCLVAKPARECGVDEQAHTWDTLERTGSDFCTP